MSLIHLRPAASVLSPGAGESSACPLMAASQMLIACGSHGLKPGCFSKVRVLGACLSGAGL